MTDNEDEARPWVLMDTLMTTFNGVGVQWRRSMMATFSLSP